MLLKLYMHIVFKKSEYENAYSKNSHQLSCFSPTQNLLQRVLSPASHPSLLPAPLVNLQFRCKEGRSLAPGCTVLRAQRMPAQPPACLLWWPWLSVHSHSTALNWKTVGISCTLLRPLLFSLPLHIFTFYYFNGIYWSLGKEVSAGVQSTFV